MIVMSKKNCFGLKYLKTSFNFSIQYCSSPADLERTTACVAMRAAKQVALLMQNFFATVKDLSHCFESLLHNIFFFSLQKILYQSIGKGRGGALLQGMECPSQHHLPPPVISVQVSTKLPKSSLFPHCQPNSKVMHFYNCLL